MFHVKVVCLQVRKFKYINPFTKCSINHFSKTFIFHYQSFSSAGIMQKVNDFIEKIVDMKISGGASNYGQNESQKHKECFMKDWTANYCL